MEVLLGGCNFKWERFTSEFQEDDSRLATLVAEAQTDFARAKEAGKNVGVSMDKASEVVDSSGEEEVADMETDFQAQVLQGIAARIITTLKTQASELIEMEGQAKKRARIERTEPSH